METEQKVKLIELLKDCFESGSFKALLPYLTEQTVRRSMWYPDIRGREALIRYFQHKEEEMADNGHYFPSIARLCYIKGRPKTDHPQYWVYLAEGKLTPKFGPRETRVVVWYPEDELVIVTRDSIIAKHGAMIRLVLDDQGFIASYNIVDPNLFAYQIVEDPALQSDEDLELGAVRHVTLNYLDKGYKVGLKDYDPDKIPQMTLEKEGQKSLGFVIVNHAPFWGCISDDILTLLRHLVQANDIPIETTLVQATGLGQAQHRILKEDSVEFTIMGHYTIAPKREIH